jgi:GNAT superfamily N-acetyltransferase
MTDADPGLVQQVLYMALDWNPEETLPPIEVVVEHPEALRYHTGWGRRGDFGVAAEIDGDFVGGAYCRLFTAEDHGHGFVDAETPEVAVAVVAGHQGAGIGGRLLQELARLARAGGYPALSLSVNVDNPAVRLYRRLGYAEISNDGGSYRMVLQLERKPHPG